MNWDRERRQRPLRNPRVGDLEIEGGYAGGSHQWLTGSPDPDSPAAQRRREQRQRDRVLLQERRQLGQDRAELLAQRKTLAAERRHLKLALRKTTREQLKLALIRRIGIGLMWSGLSNAMTRNEAARRDYLAELEQHSSDVTASKAGLEQNSLALERNRIALASVRE